MKLVLDKWELFNWLCDIFYGDNLELLRMCEETNNKKFLRIEQDRNIVRVRKLEDNQFEVSYI